MHIADLAVECFTEMVYYYSVSSLLEQDCNADIDAKPTKNNRVKASWIPPLDGRIQNQY